MFYYYVLVISCFVRLPNVNKGVSSMAGVFTNTLKLISTVWILGNLFEGNGATEMAAPHHTRIQSLAGRKCLNFLWDGIYCNPPLCRTTLKAKLEKEGGFAVTSEYSSFKPLVTHDNRSHAVCFYDSSSGENSSCCSEITSGLPTGHSVSFGDNEKIGFNVKTCMNYTGTCVFHKGWYDFILPWKNPCFFNSPCQNNLLRCKPAVNDYNCTCFMGWKGKDCTVPSYLTEQKGKCLNDTSRTVQYNKTIKQCGDECNQYSRTATSCQSFEFKKLSPGSNQGNCTFHKSNTLDHKLVSCDADYYEVTAYLIVKPHSGAGVTSFITVVNLLLILVASFVILVQY